MQTDNGKIQVSPSFVLTLAPKTQNRIKVSTSGRNSPFPEKPMMNFLRASESDITHVHYLSLAASACLSAAVFIGHFFFWHCVYKEARWMLISSSLCFQIPQIFPWKYTSICVEVRKRFRNTLKRRQPLKYQREDFTSKTRQLHIKYVL